MECAHIPCGCAVGVNGEFCSEGCSTVGDADSGPCPCNHAECGRKRSGHPAPDGDQFEADPLDELEPEEIPEISPAR